MEIRDVPGFIDRKNAMSVAHWRYRMALTQGKDLQDLRPGDQLVIARGIVTSRYEPSPYWTELEKPAWKRAATKAVSDLLRRQAA